MDQEAKSSNCSHGKANSHLCILHLKMWKPGHAPFWSSALPMVPQFLPSGRSFASLGRFIPRYFILFVVIIYILGINIY